jgi:hypothetical protein
MKNMDILKKTRVGAIIGIGGSGYDGWTSLNSPMVEIFMQHTRKVVDKIQINYCAFGKEMVEVSRRISAGDTQLIPPACADPAN